MDVRIFVENPEEIDRTLDVLAQEFPEIRLEYERLCEELRERPRQGRRLDPGNPYCMYVPLHTKEAQNAAFVVWVWESDASNINVYIRGVFRGGEWPLKEERAKGLCAERD